MSLQFMTFQHSLQTKKNVECYAHISKTATELGKMQSAKLYRELSPPERRAELNFACLALAKKDDIFPCSRWYESYWKEKYLFCHISPAHDGQRDGKEDKTLLWENGGASEVLHIHGACHKYKCCNLFLASLRETVDCASTVGLHCTESQ